MVKLTIDNRKVEVKGNATVLDAAKKLGIYIPTLCYHPGIKPYGSCRICLVEVIENGNKRMVASCVHQVSEGLKVFTNTDEIKKARRLTMELLLARSPDSEKLKGLAEEIGVKEVRFKRGDMRFTQKENCILCGLCVRACEEIVGIGAISFSYRGNKKEIGPPFKRAASICVGCGTCVYVCPTGAIKLGEIVDTPNQHYWKSEFKKVKCRMCGDYHLEPNYNSDLLKHNE